MEGSMSDNYVEDTKEKLAEAQDFLKALEGGNLHIGAPFEERTEAKAQDLRRQITMYRAIIEKNDAART
jgi:hypothetical protein